MINKLVAAGLVAFAMGGAGGSPAAAQETMISAAEPEAIRRQFASWGYEPGTMVASNDLPMFSAKISGVATVVVLGGCTGGRNCNHLVLIGTYSDVPNPPYEWLNRVNFDYNLVTAMRRDDGLLSLRAGIFLGGGVRLSTLQGALEDWVASHGEIVQRAQEAGLVRN